MSQLTLWANRGTLSRRDPRLRRGTPPCAWRDKYVETDDFCNIFVVLVREPQPDQAQHLRAIAIVESHTDAVRAAPGLLVTTRLP